MLHIVQALHKSSAAWIFNKLLRMSCRLHTAALCQLLPVFHTSLRRCESCTEMGQQLSCASCCNGTSLA